MVIQRQTKGGPRLNGGGVSKRSRPAPASTTTSEKALRFRFLDQRRRLLIGCFMVLWIALYWIEYSKGIHSPSSVSLSKVSRDWYNEQLSLPTRTPLTSGGSDVVSSKEKNPVPEGPFHIYWFGGGNTQSLGNSQMAENLRNLRIHNNSITESGLATHFPHWTPQQVQLLYSNETLQPEDRFLVLANNITLKEQKNRPRRPLQYSFEEAAHLLTHLSAIVQAYHRGHEMVLILEEEALITQEFFDNFEHYARLAPSDDWTILQWTTVNGPTYEQAYQVNLQEPWISWLPDLRGTHAYLIHRRGMQKIWNTLSRDHPTKPGKFYFELGGTLDAETTIETGLWRVLLADEVIFTAASPGVYTSTHPWILTPSIEKGIDPGSALGKKMAQTKTETGASNLPLPPALTNPNRPTLPESLLVFTNVRFSATEQMKKELDRLRADVEAVCSIHSNSSAEVENKHRKSCRWIIRTVFAHEYLFERFKGFMKESHRQIRANQNSQHDSVDGEKTSLDERINWLSNVEFETSVSNERFNKFGILASHLADMSDYNLVLLKDNDQRLAGFPWLSFLKHKGDALVAGPLRQAPHESFVKYKLWEKSQHYKFHDGFAWKVRKVAPWSTELFVQGQPIQVPFLEMYFNVFDGKFAEWFFRQVLTPSYIKQDSCWGPDYLWCAAAKEYRAVQPTSAVQQLRPNSVEQQNDEDEWGCALLPFVSVHEDTRQIFKDGEAFNDRGYAAVKALKASNRTFQKWFTIAEKYAQGVIAWRQLDGITKHCRSSVLNIRDMRAKIDFKACIRGAMTPRARIKNGKVVTN